MEAQAACEMQERKQPGVFVLLTPSLPAHRFRVAVSRWVAHSSCGQRGRSPSPSPSKGGRVFSCHPSRLIHHPLLVLLNPSTFLEIVPE